MKRQAVQSSSLRSVGYDPHLKILEVEFVEGGRVYQYTGVRPREYEALMSADSHGRYYALNIRDKHPYRRIR